MKYFIFVFMILLLLSAYNFAEKQLYLPQIPSLQKVDSYFNSNEQLISYLNRTQTSAAYFKAGLYIYYNVLDLISDLGGGKDQKREYLEKAIEYLKKAYNMESQNPIFLTILAGAIGLKCAYTDDFTELLEFSRRSQKYYAKAIKMDPENPEIRLNRFYGNINLPYQYYPDYLLKTQEDAELVILWANEIIEAAKADSSYTEIAEWLLETKNQVLYRLGEYFFKQVKENGPAFEYLKRVEPGSTYYNDAQNIIKQIPH